MSPRDPLSTPAFGDIFRWHDDPPDSFVMYLCPDPEIEGAMVCLYLDDEPAKIEDNVIAPNDEESQWEAVP